MSSRIRHFASISLALATLALGATALASPGSAALSPDQKAKLDAPKQAERAARADLNKVLAQQVEAGAVDRAALAPQIAAEKQAHANVKATLDAILTPEQKAEMQKHREEHQAKHEGERRERFQLTREQKEQLHARMAAEPKGDRGVDRMIDRYHAMVPILTPAQRAELANDLRK
jgi:Spy/CpxP family protein refolding chaperone